MITSLQNSPAGMSAVNSVLGSVSPPTTPAETHIVKIKDESRYHHSLAAWRRFNFDFGF